MISDKLAKIIMPFIVTTCFFYIEAVIHYNIGKKGYIAFKLPPIKKICLLFLLYCSSLLYRHVFRILFIN